MRLIIQLILVFLLAIAVPMLSCQAVYKLGIHSGEIVCGHNGWIQIVVIFFVGSAIVIVKSMLRQDKSSERSETSTDNPQSG